MKSSEVIERVFNYQKSHLLNMGIIIPTSIAKQTVVTVCDLKENDSLTNPLVCVLPIRDSIAGQFIRQDRVGVELQLVCYTPTFYQLAGSHQLDELVRDSMLDFVNHNPPGNFYLVRRFLSRWVDRLTAFQSIQIYQFHIVDN